MYPSAFTKCVRSCCIPGDVAEGWGSDTEADDYTSSNKTYKAYPAGAGVNTSGMSRLASHSAPLTAAYGSSQPQAQTAAGARPGPGAASAATGGQDAEQDSQQQQQQSSEDAKKEAVMGAQKEVGGIKDAQNLEGTQVRLGLGEGDLSLL